MIRAVATSTVLQVLSLALSMVDRILVSALMLRFWGVGVFEDWSVLIAMASFLGFLDFGLHMTFGNTFTEAYQSGRIEVLQRRVTVALFINACIMALSWCGLFAVTLSGHSGAIAGTSHMPGWEAGLVLALTGSVVAIQTFAGAVVTIYRALGLFPRSLAIDLGTTLARTLLTLICIGSNGSPVMVAGIVLAAQAVAIFVAIPWDLARACPEIQLRPRSPTWYELKEISTIAPQFYIQHSANVALMNLPVLLLSYTVDASGAVASFLFTRTLVNLMRQIMAALSNALGIELSRSHVANHASIDAAIELTRAGDLITVVSSCAYGVLLVTVGCVMTLLSGGKLQGDIGLAAILGFALVANAPFAGVLSFLNYSGRIGHLTRSRIITVAISCVGALLFMRHGLLGIGLALALGETIGGSFVYLKIASEKAGTCPSNYIWRTIRLVTIGLAPILAIGGTINVLLTLPPAILLMVQLMVLGPLSLVLVYFFGLAKPYRDRLNQVLRKRMKPALSS